MYPHGSSFFGLLRFYFLHVHRSTEGFTIDIGFSAFRVQTTALDAGDAPTVARLLDKIEDRVLYSWCEELRERVWTDAVLRTLCVALKSTTVLRDVRLFGVTTIASAHPFPLELLFDSLTHPEVNITNVSLSDNCIDDAGAQLIANALTRSSNLRSITLNRNRIGDAGAAAIAGALMSPNCLLDRIDMSNNLIGDAGAAAIAHVFTSPLCARLCDMNMMNNLIDDAGAVALATRLAHNTTIGCLNLSSNKIGDRGAEALCKAAQRNTHLKKLLLESNPCRGEIVKTISAATEVRRFGVSDVFRV